MSSLDNLFDQIQPWQEKMKKLTAEHSMPYVSMPYENLISALKTPDVDPIPLADHLEKTEEYQKRSLEILQSIEENTASIYTLVDLISKANEKQDEMLGILSEILSIAKAKSKEEADSRYKAIMSRISTSVDNVEAMIKVAGWASAVYRVVIKLIPAIGG